MIKHKKNTFSDKEFEKWNNFVNNLWLFQKIIAIFDLKKHNVFLLKKI